MTRPYSTLASLALACCLLAAPAGAGLYYETTTTVDNGQGDSKTRAWIDGDNARIEFAESEIPLIAKGSYLVTTDGGLTIFLVDDDKKTYSEWDMAAMLNLAEGMAGMVNLEFSTPEVQHLEEKPGGEVVGLDTTYHRYRTSYEMKLKMFGMKRQTKSVSEQEMWVTDKYDVPALGVWLRKGGTAGDSSLDKVIQAEMSKVQGVPLKTINVTTNTDQKGREQTSRSETLVTELRETSTADIAFSVPKGYEQVPLLPGLEDENGDSPLKGIFGGGR